MPYFLVLGLEEMVAAVECEVDTAATAEPKTVAFPPLLAEEIAMNIAGIATETFLCIATTLDVTPTALMMGKNQGFRAFVSGWDLGLGLKWGLVYL